MSYFKFFGVIGEKDAAPRYKYTNIPIHNFSIYLSIYCLHYPQKQRSVQRYQKCFHMGSGALEHSSQKSKVFNKKK